MLCYVTVNILYVAVLCFQDILPNNIADIGTCPPLFKIILF